MFAAARLHNGFKVMVAGCLAFAIAVALHLHQPAWSVVTVLFLMTTQFLGDLLQRAVLRVMATVMGALAALWLVQLAEVAPWIFLGLFFFSLWILVYGFYAWPNPLTYLVMGLTLVVICGSTYNQPELLWPIAVARVQEITLGVGCALVSSVLFWPRRAVPEFFATASEYLSRVAGAFEALDPELEPGKEPRLPDIAELTTQLRTLRVGGERESLNFRRRSHELDRLVSDLNHLHEAVEQLQPALSEGGRFLEYLRPEFSKMKEAAAADCRLLSHAVAAQQPPAGNDLRLPTACREIEDRIDELVKDGTLLQLSDSEVLKGSSFLALFQDTALLLREMVEARDLSTPEAMGREPGTDPRDRREFIVQAGKAAFVTAVTLLLAQRLAPPGAAVLPLVAYAFAILGNSQPSGIGDLGSLGRWARYAAVGLPAVGVAYLIAPLALSFPVLLCFLAVYLFLFGFFIAAAGGMTPSFFLIMMGLGIFLHFEEINPAQLGPLLEAYFGVVLAVGLVTGFSRVAAPRLPQREFADQVEHFFRECASLLRLIFQDQRTMAQLGRLRARLALAPNHLRSRIGVLPGVEGARADKLRELVATLHQLLLAFGIMIRARPRLEVASEAFRERQVAFAEEAMEVLGGLGDYAAAWRSLPPALDRLDRLVEQAEEAVHEARRSGSIRSLPVATRSHLFTAARHHAVARDLLVKTVALLREIDLPHLRRDSRL